jgi:hypothetical protein
LHIDDEDDDFSLAHIVLSDELDEADDEMFQLCIFYDEYDYNDEMVECLYCQIDDELEVEVELDE